MTIKQWFETLEEPIKSKALIYLSENPSGWSLSEVSSLSVAILCGFDWESTVEGWDYWNKMQLETIKKEKLTEQKFSSTQVISLMNLFKISLATDPNLNAKDWLINNA